MSKYQTESTKVRKDEAEGHQTSFQQDKQYSYSRASQHGSKILDNVNQALNNNNSKLGDKDILDMMDDSFQDNQKQEDSQNQEAVQNNNKEKRESLAVQSSLQEENNSQVQQQLEKNNETEQDQDQKLKASERLFQFFKKAPESVNKSSKNSAALLMNSLSFKKKGELGKVEQQKDLKTSTFDQEQIVYEDEFANLDEQQDFNQDDKKKNNKKKKQEVGGKVNNPQDFGNISEIQEKKNLRENNDESAQDVDLQDLLNNPNKKKQDEELQKKSAILGSINTNQNSMEQVKIEEGQRKQSIEKNNLSQNSMRNSKRLGSSSLSPQNKYAESEEKRKRIEEAQRKKRELEEELKLLQSEMAQINNANDEKKKKENKFIKYSEISEDKDAQEHALSLIRKMNLARKEKELKMQKERDMFNKLLQEDIKESHERQLRIKEKMNEEKKEKISQKLEQIRIRSEERKIINKQSNLIIKDIKKDLQVNNPEERYKQEVELPELEKRKKELAEKRKLYKPIDLQEIREHAKKHDEEIKIRKLQAKTNVLAEYNSFEGDNYKYPKSSALNKVLEDDKLFKMKEVIEMQKKKEQIERRREYAKLVKEVHVPRVKPKPNLDMENQQLYDDESQNNYNPQQQSQAKSHNIIRTPNNFGINQQSLRAKKVGIGFSSNSNLSPSNQQNRVNRISYKPNKNGNVNRSQGREQFKEQPNFNKQDQQLELYNRTDDLSNQKSSLYNPAFDENMANNDNDNNNNNRASNLYAGKSSYSSNSAQNKPVKQTKQFKPPAIEEPPKPPQKKYQVDYIQELRKQREEQEKKIGKKSKLEDWEKYKYDPSLSSNEKYKFILQSANRLEHNAKLKELRSNNNNDFDAQEQANNLYIDSIKAKLALLDNIN
ncbi:hypothetical protein ABPG72_002012 [Tetrahymena utriculariae]